MATNKIILNRGMKYLVWALPAVFIGPAIIHFAFINKQQSLYLLVLGIGITVAITGIILTFKGILTLVKSLFEK
ncbi:MAG TPA: DUF6095 family protein [Flavobacterium sp.]|jgi:hypothetical protein